MQVDGAVSAAASESSADEGSSDDEDGCSRYYAAYHDMNLQLEMAICDADREEATSDGADRAELDRAQLDSDRGPRQRLDAPRLSIIATQRLSAGAEIRNTCAHARTLPSIHC